jgi:hypothetical protein
MLVHLEKEKDLRGGKVPWTSCKPFVENTMAVLIHRPRRVTTHKIGPRWDPHIAVHAWCGNSMTGSTKFTFLDAPPVGRIVCARCEEKAVLSGLPSSSGLTGSHVHIGKVFAVATCCQEPTP